MGKNVAADYYILVTCDYSTIETPNTKPAASLGSEP